LGLPGVRVPEPIAKLPTGIEGFDQITGGGLPRERTTLLMGGPGSGKTIFALQTLVNGARLRDEAGIFVAFEENPGQIVANAATFGWDLSALKQQKLFFLDAIVSPEVVQGGEFDLTGVLAALKAKAAEMGARRIVFDGIDILLTLLENPAAERREMYRLHYWLQEAGMTGILTAKGEGSDALRYGFLQFMADCVVVFHHRLLGNVSVRGLQVAKYRGSSHSANEFPLVITSAGMEVASYSAAELVQEGSTERVSSGIQRLDAVLGGGYYRGSCVLVSGSPGTAKTTLAGAFAEASCLRGERALFISFDEAGQGIVRNLASVGIRLAPHLESGLLRIYALRTGAFSPYEHFTNTRVLIARHQPSCLVIDPISTLNKVGGQVTAVDLILRLIDFAKAQGITLLCTSLTGSPDALQEATPTNVSTIADTWIHLSYVIQGGERNRALTVVKSRGSRHSNQVWELLLSDQGVTLVDVYTAGGEVLMGTARWEKETQEKTQELLRLAEFERKRRELGLAAASIQAQLQALHQELEAQQSEVALLEAEEKGRLVREGEERAERVHLRGGGEAREGQRGTPASG
jgi:circadian clock protein KaiC